jgi:hypothetical protein
VVAAEGAPPGLLIIAVLVDVQPPASFTVTVYEFATSPLNSVPA